MLPFDVEASGSSEVPMCRKYSVGLVLSLSFLLLQTGCAVTPPTSSPPKQVMEFRWLAARDAKKTAQLVKEFFEVTADGDEYSNTVIIKGPPEAVAQATEMVAKLTAGIYDEPRERIFIKPLKNAKARDLASLLQEMTKQSYFPKPDLFSVVPHFIADDRTNSLIIHADYSQQEQIRGTIDDLDRPLESQ
jgi:type II secretory pathway component GspD/PulD (secretin)